jgi:hypothetical protein
MIPHFHEHPFIFIVYIRRFDSSQLGVLLQFTVVLWMARLGVDMVQSRQIPSISQS